MKISLKLLTIISIVFAVLCISVPSNALSIADDDKYNIDDPSRGNIREFKDAYIPKEYHPMPEYMVFVDLAILLLIIAAGVFFVLKRKSGKPMNTLMIITFVYLAFIRGGCICPVGAVTNTVFGIINPALVGLATLIVFIAPLFVALFAGRVFCTAGCPLGAVQHLGKKKNSRKYFKLPKKINSILKFAPVIILGLTVYYALQSKIFFFACELDPYKAIFFTGQSWFEQGLAFIKGQPMESKILIGCGFGTWTYLVIILAIGYFLPRPFCRFICPYGVLLGVFAYFSIKPRRIDKNNCVYCNLCEKVCPTQAIVIDKNTQTTKLSNYDCIQCNKCNESCKKDAIK